MQESAQQFYFVESALDRDARYDWAPRPYMRIRDTSLNTARMYFDRGEIARLDDDVKHHPRVLVNYPYSYEY